MPLGGSGLNSGSTLQEGTTGLQSSSTLEGGGSVAAATYNTPPTFQVTMGTVQGFTAGGTLDPPAASAIGSLEIAVFETPGGEAVSLSDAAGFVAFPNSPQATGAGTAGTQLSAYWRRATLVGVGAGIVVADSGDHQMCRIFIIDGVRTSGTPYDDVQGAVKAAASVAATAPALTTTKPNCLVLHIVTHDLDTTGGQFSAQACASLASITERMDSSVAAGNGGGISVCSGVKVAAGAVDAMTATVASSINASMSIALVPAA